MTDCSNYRLPDPIPDKEVYKTGAGDIHPGKEIRAAPHLFGDKGCDLPRVFLFPPADEHRHIGGKIPLGGMFGKFNHI